MNANPNYIVKSPVITEESTLNTETGNKYTFKVDPRANKGQIRTAIEQIFNVKVISINTMNYQGKISGRRGKGTPGRRPSWKKAVVTLREGDAIDLI